MNHMNLSDIKRISCSIQLRTKLLACLGVISIRIITIFGVIDFMLSPSLEKVNVLLQNRFDRFYSSKIYPSSHFGMMMQN